MIDRPLRADARRNRERILLAAAEVFAARGLDATLHDVAARADVGVGTVYRRFPDKQALIAALFEHKVDELVGVVEEATTVPDPWSSLVAVLDRLTRFAAADHGLAQIVGGLASSNPPGGPHDEAFRQGRQRLHQALSAALARSTAAGVLRPGVEPIDLVVIWRVLTELAQHTRPARDQAWERYLELFLDGLRAHPGHTALRVPALTRAEAARVRPQRPTPPHRP